MLRLLLLVLRQGRAVVAQEEPEEGAAVVECGCYIHVQTMRRLLLVLHSRRTCPHRRRLPMCSGWAPVASQAEAGPK